MMEVKAQTPLKLNSLNGSPVRARTALHAPFSVTALPNFVSR